MENKFLEKKRNYLVALTVIGLMFGISACKKSETPAPATPTTTSTTPMGTIGFHLHTNISNTEADSAVEIHDTISGRYFKLTMAQFFISEIVAYTSTGVAVPMKNVYLLKDIDQEEYIIGQIPVGNYSYVSFNVGIDSTTNAEDPSSFPASSPLSNASTYNGGWFGGTFIFMNVQGAVDTSVAHTGKFVNFSYQTGTNPELEHVTMPSQPFTITANQTQLIHIICDYGKLLSVVNLSTQSTANPWNNLATIQTISSNIPNMFRYETTEE